jgi:hypothetical protein
MAIAKLRPTKNADGTSVVLPSRTGAYGEAYNYPISIGRYGLADEGSYWTATNATYGTALAAHVAPAIADTDTKPIIHLFNSGTNDIYLDYIDMIATIANASATSVGFQIYVDAKGTTAKTSGGTVITPLNVRSNSTTTTGVVMTAGAVVAAPTASKKVMQRTIKEFIGVALDRYSFSFGNGLLMTPTTTYIAGATAIMTYGPPIVLAPGGNLMFSQVSPSGAATAMTFEFELGFWER